MSVENDNHYHLERKTGYNGGARVRDLRGNLQIKKMRRLFFAAVFAASFLTAPARASSGGIDDGARWQVLVVMDEYRFAPDHIVLTAGRDYELIIKNEGAIPHEWDSPDLLAAIESQKVVIAKDGEMLGEVYGAPDEIEVAPGYEARWFFRAKKPTGGKTKILCDLEGHLEAGMHGAIEIR
jgi:uncharacterized cupredoxin-like copper-binding protein